MRTFKLTVLLGMLAPVAIFGEPAFGNVAAYYFDGYYYEREPRIVVETKDCSGASGLATFRAARVFSVQEGDCRNPDAPDQTLHQVLLQSLSGVSRYDVIWVDEAGVETIRQQLEENRQLLLRRRPHY